MRGISGETVNRSETLINLHIKLLFGRKENGTVNLGTVNVGTTVLGRTITGLI